MHVHNAWSRDLHNFLYYREMASNVGKQEQPKYPNFYISIYKKSGFQIVTNVCLLL